MRFVYLSEGKFLRGETAISTLTVSGIMDEIVNEYVSEESEIVRPQVKNMYLGAAVVLSNHKTVNSNAFETVKYNFAFYVRHPKQNDVLHVLIIVYHMKTFKDLTKASLKEAANAVPASSHVLNNYLPHNRFLQNNHFCWTVTAV